MQTEAVGRLKSTAINKELGAPDGALFLGGHDARLTN